MISKSNYRFILTCDKCGKSINFKKFDAAVKYANIKKYKIKLTENGGYKSICMRCQNEE